jgi:hypothetical protein
LRGEIGVAEKDGDKRGEKKHEALRLKSPLKGLSLLGGRAPSLREEIREHGKEYICIYMYTSLGAVCHDMESAS